MENLLAGLADGTIVLEPAESKLFPNLARELARESNKLSGFASAPACHSWLSGRLPSLLEWLLREEREFVDVVGDLESSIRLAREMRLTPERPLAQDLWLYTQLITKQAEQILTRPSEPEFAREPILDAIRLGRMLEMALEEETPVVEELTFQLQIALAEVLKAVLQLAASRLQRQLYISVMAALQQSEEFRALEREARALEREAKEIVGYADISELGNLLGYQLQPALSRATDSRIGDVQVLIETLQMALKRVQATTPPRGAPWAKTWPPYIESGKEPNTR